MKRLILISMAVAALALASCSDDAMTGQVTKEGYGKILFRGTADGMVATRAQIDATTLGVTVPAAGDFNLELTSDMMNEPVSGVTVSQFNAKSQESFFEKGDYKAVVTWGDPTAEGTNKPFYYGEKDFTVVARQTNTVDITACIANSLAEVRTTEKFDTYFEDATFTLTTGSGNTFTFTPSAGTVPATIFVAAGTQLEVKGTARVQSQNGVDPGAEVTLSAQPLEATVARTRHIFIFDATEAGSATLTITIDEDNTILENVEIELNEYAK